MIGSLKLYFNFTFCYVYYINNTLIYTLHIEIKIKLYVFYFIIYFLFKNNCGYHNLVQRVKNLRLKNSEFPKGIQFVIAKEENQGYL